jgi:site-specific recombinase XerD
VTHAQYTAILDAVYTPLYRGVFAVMYGCGLRISEAVALKAGDIDNEAMTLRVIGKGNKERLVPLTQGLLEDLRLVWKGHRCERWLFPNKAGTNHISADNVERLLRKIRSELGLGESLTPHSLRHGFAMRLFEQDMPAETIAILMGHGNVNTTKQYLHLTEPICEQVKQAAANFYVPLFD